MTEMTMTTEAQETKFFAGIVGARSRCSYDDEKFVRNLVWKLKKKHGFALTIVSGGCYGGPDLFAKQYARGYDVDYLEHPVQGGPRGKWEYRKAAYARNTLVARDSRDVLFALVQVPRKGGTEDTVTKYQDHIIDGDTRRKLYLVFPDFSTELWTPEVRKSSEWEIWNGNVSRRA